MFRPNSNAGLLTLRAFSLSVFSPSSAYQNGLTLSQHMRPNKPQSKTLLVFLFALFCIYVSLRIFFIRTPELSPHTCGPINFTLKLASPLYCAAHCRVHSYFHPTIQYIGGAMKFIAANKLSEPSTRDHHLSLKGDIERQPGSDERLINCLKNAGKSQSASLILKKIDPS